MKANHISNAGTAILASTPESAVYLGCDSIRYRKGGQMWAKYSTVIALHHNGKNGCQLFYDSVDMPDYGSIKQRMMTEVGFAVQHATDIVEAVGDRHFEIHLDINPDPKHKSNVALKEAAGYVRGAFGFDATVKPNAWAATHAADHAVRNKFEPVN